MSDQPTRAEMGQQAINLLGQSRLARPEDGKLLRIGTEDPLEAANRARQAEANDPVSVADSVEAHLMTVDDVGMARDNKEDDNDDSGR